MSLLATLGVEPAVGLAREIQRCPLPALVALGLFIAVMFGVMGLVGERLPEPKHEDDDDICPRELVERLIATAVTLGVFVPAWLLLKSWWGC